MNKVKVAKIGKLLSKVMLIEGKLYTILASMYAEIKEYIPEQYKDNSGFQIMAGDGVCLYFVPCSA